MSSPHPTTAVSAEKYSVRRRLKITNEDITQEESSCQPAKVDHSETAANAKANNGAVVANANDSFASSEDSGVSAQHDLPLRHPNLGLSSARSTPSTPYKNKGFKGKRIDTGAASRFSSSASSSPSKRLMLRRGADKSAPPSASALKMKDWRKKEPSPKSAKSGNWRKDAPITEAETPGASSARRVPLDNPEVNSARRVPPGVEINEINAQNYYFPRECLFLANLDATAPEQELQAELEAIFKQHGTCYVKVQKDKRNMPQAFIQFTCRSDAEKALEVNKSLVMRGRSVRIEWSKANREYYIASKDGSIVSEEVARHVLSRFGAIEKFLAVGRLEAINGFAERGLFVIFESYQSGRDAVRLLHSSQEWIVVEHDRAGRKKAETPLGRRTQALLESYAIDRNSAFIGNLRVDVTEQELHDLCDKFGKIINISILRRPSNWGDKCDPNCFAHVQFTNPEEVRAAVDELAGLSVPLSTSRLKTDFKKSQEVLYGSSAKPTTRAHDMALSTPSRMCFNVAMGQIGMQTTAAGQTAYPASPQVTAFQQQPPVYAPLAYAPAYYPGPPTLAALGQQGPPYSPFAAPIGLQPSPQVVAQANGYHAPPVPAGYAHTSEGPRMFYPPNRPYPFPQHTNVGGPPPIAANAHHGHGHPDPQPVLGPPPSGGYWYPFPPPYYQQPVYAGGPVAPQQVAQVAPSSLYPDSGPSPLSPNANFNVVAGAAAVQHGGINPLDLAYGRDQDLSAAQAQMQADAIVDKHLGEGATISPKKLDAPNEPCSVADIIAGPQDDIADAKTDDSRAELSKDAELTVIVDKVVNAKKEGKKAKKPMANKRGKGRKDEESDSKDSKDPSA